MIFFNWDKIFVIDLYLRGNLLKIRNLVFNEFFINFRNYIFISDLRFVVILVIFFMLWWFFVYVIFGGFINGEEEDLLWFLVAVLEEGWCFDEFLGREGGCGGVGFIFWLIRSEIMVRLVDRAVSI